MSIRIMVVDDSPIIRKILTKAIRSCKVEIDTIFEAANGIEALDILSKEWIDIVFTDLNMPKMGGMELIENIRKDDANMNTPVVVVSSIQNDAVINQAKELGVLYYLKKPFKPEQINLIFDDILGNLDPF